MLLGLSGHLLRLFSSTNIIENLNGAVQDRCRRVRRWRNGEMVVRWAVSSLIEAGKNFRPIMDWGNLRSVLQASEQNVVVNTADKLL